uniref:Ovule protein n=1 Tax=Ascaris lumbricoides TaxID=6252 RepID=A0A0M3I4U0_ASCLU
MLMMFWDVKGEDTPSVECFVNEKRILRGRRDGQPVAKKLARCLCFYLSLPYYRCSMMVHCNMISDYLCKRLHFHNFPSEFHNCLISSRSQKYTEICGISKDETSKWRCWEFHFTSQA